MEESPDVWTALQDGDPQNDVAVVAVSWSLRYCREDAWHPLSPSGIVFALLSRHSAVPCVARSPRTNAAVVFGISTVGVVGLCKPQGFHRIVSLCVRIRVMGPCSIIHNTFLRVFMVAQIFYKYLVAQMSAGMLLLQRNRRTDLEDAQTMTEGSGNAWFLHIMVTSDAGPSLSCPFAGSSRLLGRGHLHVILCPTELHFIWY